MKNHSMIFDDFFENPEEVKRMIDAAPMKDIKFGLDGVTYPNITELPHPVFMNARDNLEQIFGPITPKVWFARYSFENSKPPHWAHSDREISQYLALVYLSEGPPPSGTFALRHQALGFETHPTKEDERKALIEDSNNLEAWDFTFECPAKFNRLLILNNDFIHAAGNPYGTTKEDGRLVISLFFDIGSN